MPSSGTGTSFNNDFRKCMQYGFLRHVMHLAPRGELFAPPLVVGEAVHKFCEVTFKEWMGGRRDRQEVSVLAEAVYRETLRPYYVLGAERDADDLTAKLEERDVNALRVLGQWLMQQWARLESGLDVPIAVEVPISVALPAETGYGPIAEHLREFTGRIDLVVERKDDLSGNRLGITIRDHKSTTSNDLAGYLAGHYRSDEHLGYAYGWNQDHRGDDACTQIEYSAMRLRMPINAKTFMDERRPIRPSQLESWYDRMLAFRAMLSVLWPTPEWYAGAQEWTQNNSPAGPCVAFGRRCEYFGACENPGQTFEEVGLEVKA